MNATTNQPTYEISPGLGFAFFGVIAILILYTSILEEKEKKKQQEEQALGLAIWIAGALAAALVFWGKVE